MEYKGSIYGKIGGKYFKLEKDTDYFDKLDQETAKLKEELGILKRKIKSL